MLNRRRNCRRLDDIEKVVAEIEKEEAQRHCVKEVIINPPSRRVNFTLTAHPYKDELIMLGGEFHDGRQTIVYGDMFFYNINKQEWTLIKAPGAPPPRCGHQAVVTANRNGELWVFGGEFISPSELQFYHYRDLWVFRFAERKWEKITAANGPSARSGHRMIYTKKQLIVFGGFHDNLRHDYKYFNDIHIFDLETYLWRKIEPTGIAPAPRSGCIFLPTSDNKLVVYGGYSKEKMKKDIDRGCIHADMFLLTQKSDKDVIKYKWVSAKQAGVRVTPRCGVSAALVQSANAAFVFGGVHDNDNDDDDEEGLHGIFYNDLLALDLEKLHWRPVTLSEKKSTVDDSKGRRRRKKEETDKELGQSNISDEEEAQEESSNLEQSTVTVDDDGIFTMTVGPTAPITSLSLHQSCSTVENDSGRMKNFPPPRMNAGMVIKHNVLYLYGGLVEDGDRQYTLCDFYSLDCRKLDEWKTLRSDDLSLQTWFESSSEEDEDEEENSEENQGQSDESELVE
ncbi:kelch domain-containing protein 4-like isoform X1 [Nylanderia fulva]|uniref:kelch domain-containing protein 4-like isoform X1 n=1 Tax=Nylanderia fulva TaxID=613905 RepID=UPI0010FB9989|nr:kelch domain-containing protein 4-like isoform X1 [Nylanderia fulva]